jgi:FkbM family methyltransferase
MHDTPLAVDLVFDVGLHRGEDSDYYLRKGYRVVAFEANPILVQDAERRFSAEIESGTMQIVEGAIDDRGRETVTFFVHPRESVWGTTDEVWATRNASRGGRSAPIEVPSVDFVQSVLEFGVPYYMKVDIEGADRTCLEALLEFENRPAYVSVESEKSDWNALEEEFDLLERLGYREFALCQQSGISRHELLTRTTIGDELRIRFPEGSSGPFGEDVAEAWVDRTDALDRYARIFRRYKRFGDGSLMGRTRPGRVVRQTLSSLLGQPLPGWYDTHARR